MLRRGIVAALLFFQSVVFAGDLREQLRALYPHLTNPAFQRKLDAVETEYDFYRSFVPYFYLFLNEKQSEVPVLQSLDHCRGWCVGDPHVENFAILSPTLTSSILSLDDGDDSGPGYLTLDILRLIVSAKLIDDDLKISDLLDVYKTGLLNKSHKNSAPIRNRLSELRERGLKARARDIASDQIHLLRPKPGHDHRDSMELTNSEQNELNELIANFDLEPMTDGFRYVRYYGGSGGLTRYRILAKSDITNEPVVLEFKELVDPGIVPFDPQISMPDVYDRAHDALLRLQNLTNPLFYGVVTISGHAMLVKPRWDSNETLEQQDFTKKEFRKIAIDIAYRLGEIHKGSANDLRSYMKSFNDLKLKDWKPSATVCVQIIRKSFSEIRAR